MDAIRLMNTYWKYVTAPETNWRLRLCFYLNMACAYQGYVGFKIVFGIFKCVIRPVKLPRHK